MNRNNHISCISMYVVCMSCHCNCKDIRLSRIMTSACVCVPVHIRRLFLRLYFYQVSSTLLLLESSGSK